MPVIHVSRRRIAYYLHVGKTKTGKPKYWFSKSSEGALFEEIPNGFEVYESPQSQVFLRKIVPQLITPFEIAVVESGLKNYAPDQECLVDVQGRHIVIYHSERFKLDLNDFGFGRFELPPSSGYSMKIMRFTLVDDVKRTFKTQRWCFRGSIDDWIEVGLSDRQEKLSDHVEKFCPHIGEESFFELF